MLIGPEGPTGPYMNMTSKFLHLHASRTNANLIGAHGLA